MLESKIADWFAENGWTWNLKGGRTVVPTDSDVERALDEAVKQLYNEPVGTQLQVGRLIIEKKNQGYDVYMYVGEYY